MAATQDPIDPTELGQYPVILSDALLGKGSREAVTSIKYNYKPSPASDTSQGDTIIHPADPGADASANSYNLTFTEEKEEYAYQGSRQPGESQYVLIFSPERKAFILHQVDSTFNMNVVSTPWDQDADSLRATYPHVQATTIEAEAPKRRKAEPKSRAQPKPQAKSQAKAPAKSQAKAQPKKAKAVQREPTPEDEESDDGLKIEYPDGPPRRSNHSVPILREPVHQEDRESSEEESDAGEDERDRDVDVLRLPSPAHDLDDNYLDIEAELTQALDLDVHGGDESSESEEE